jgi:hypothetical protein
MPFQDRFRQALSQLPLRDLQIRVEKGDFNRYLGFVISPDFEGMDEGDRQVLVWNHLQKTFDLDEMGQIEFFFTDAPSELVG